MPTEVLLPDRAAGESLSRWPPTPGSLLLGASIGSQGNPGELALSMTPAVKATGSCTWAVGPEPVAALLAGVGWLWPQGSAGLAFPGELGCSS